MGIKSVKIVNLLSFDEFIINDFVDVNCIIGKNNTGKSNLLKLIRYFYEKLDGKKTLPPSLHCPYSSYGSITIIYDTTRIKKIVESTRNNSNFFKHIYNTLFKKDHKKPIKLKDISFPPSQIRTNFSKSIQKSTYELTLKINNNDSIKWSEKNKDVRKLLNLLYPFFEVETRHIELHDWENLWDIISKLKSFNIKNLERDEVINFIDNSISNKNNSYREYIEKIEGAVDTSTYTYKEKVLNYIKIGLKGYIFTASGKNLSFESDGTNSYKYIELLLTLLITLTRREYITPTIYIDEPEIGLHPKKNEELIEKIYDTYFSFKKKKRKRNRKI